jgi:hypothetical protein
MSKATSKIARDTAAALLAIYAGETITHEQLGAAIEAQYAYARKRTGFASYFQILDIIEPAGVTVEHTPDYNHRYTFPAAA